MIELAVKVKETLDDNSEACLSLFENRVSSLKQFEKELCVEVLAFHDSSPVY